MAFLATLSGAVWGQTIDLSNPQAATGVSIDNSSKVITINNAGTYNVTGSTTEYRLEVAAEGTTNITFTDVTIDLAANSMVGPFSLVEYKDANVNLTIEGTNLLRSTEGRSNANAAITVRQGQSLTIKGTGILRVEGGVGIGNSSGSCGNITVESGTVVAQGERFSIGGSSSPTGGDSPTFTMGENAFLVLYDPHTANQRFFNITPFGGKNTPDGGIYCNIRNDGTTGYIYGNETNVTLNSPFPSDNFKIDLNGKTLTLGEGSYAREDQITGSGTLNAYKVTYNLNQTVGSNTITTDNANSYGVYYCGKTTPLLATPEATNSTAPTWQNLGWADANNTTITTTPNNDPGSINDSGNQITATAVWVVKQWTTVNVNTGETIDEAIQLVYPDAYSVTISEQTPGTLSTYGAKLDETKIVAGDAEDKAGEATDNAVNVILTITGYDDKTITIPFKVNNDAPSFADESVTTVTVSDKEYTGSAINPIDEVTVNGEKIEESNYEVKYQSDNEGSAGNDLEAAPVNVGTYWVYIKAKDNSTSYQGKSDPKQFKITPATATVTAADATWTIGDEGPTFTLTVNGVGSDELTATYTTTTPSSWSEPGIYNVSISGITLSGTAASNYNKVESATGKLTVKATGTEETPIDPNPGDGDEDEEPIIKPGDEDGNTDGWTWDATNNQWTRVYDGVSHPFTSITITYTDETAEGGTKTEKLTVGDGDTDVKVTYYSTDENDEQTVTEIKNHGTYYAHIMINKEDAVISGVVEPIKLYIDQRPMDVTINQITAEDLDETSVTAIGATYEVFNAETNRGLVEAEKEYAGISGTMSVTPKESTTEGTKEYTVTFYGLALASSGGDSPTFLANNYTPTFKYGDNEITTDNPSVDITIDEITPGNETEISDGDEDDNDWTWDNESNYYIVTYDGNPHGIAQVDGKEPTKVTYSTTDENAPVNAGYYTATVIVEGKTGRFNLWIKQRPLTVNFNLSSITEEQIDKTLDANGYVAFSGNVTGETPLLDDEATITIADKANANGKYAVTFDNILLVTNEKFLPNNYTPTYYLNGEPIAIDDNGDGESGGEGDDEGDDEGGITITPDKDDDDDPNHGHGGNTPGGDGKVDYYNMYVDTAATCDGVELSFSKNMVREGNQVSVYIDKILEGYNADDMKLWFKRSLYGYWEELEEGVQPGEYIIYNIYTDIYVKATNVEKNPTGIEEIEGVKVYAQDGSLYVYTPSRLPVWIISMTGAVVRNEEQIGLQQYDRLNRGIYIVRVGEQIFKLKL